MIKAEFKSIILFALLFQANTVFSQTKELPLITGKLDTTKYLVFHISGDGGWRGFDVKMAEEFKNNGLSYIALSSLKYFWTTKTPDQLVKDVEPVLKDTLQAWHKKEIVLVGFSFGAEIMPFVITRLPDYLKQKIKLMVLITPARTSDFTIHLTDLMGVGHNYAYDVAAEVEKIKTTKILAIFGEKENSTFPKTLKQANLKITFVKGSHHFTDAKAVMGIIMQELNIK